MFYQLRRTLATRRFHFSIRRVMDTPPLIARPAPVPLRIVSMLTTRHLPMYLLAIKSLHRHLPGGDVVVLDDGSLTEADREALRRHVRPLTIRRLHDVETGACPSGGCWERLLQILEMSRESYVVQLDSDVLASAPVPEVVSAIEENASFTLGSARDLGIEPVEASAERVAARDGAETQTRAERCLPSLPGGLGRLYVRGSAGFAGFARGAATRDLADAFSAAMRGCMGERWSEWGTEQVASNWIVANAPGGRVLPWARYRCFNPYAPPGLTEAAALNHFLGTYRFSGGTYARLGRRVIAELGA